MLKQRNDELFEENHRLQQEHQRQPHNYVWRPSIQQPFANEALPPPTSSGQLSQQQQQQLLPIENVPVQVSSPLKLSAADPRRDRPKSKII